MIFTYILEVFLSTGCFQPCLLHVTLQELSGVLPDMMTLAKPLAGGLPIGAVLLTEVWFSLIQNPNFLFNFWVVHKMGNPEKV